VGGGADRGQPDVRRGRGERLLERGGRQALHEVVVLAVGLSPPAAIALDGAGEIPRAQALAGLIGTRRRAAGQEQGAEEAGGTESHTP
jgi:hypothetical protein